MKTVTFRGRSSVVLENEHLRVTITEYGGHLAEMMHRSSSVDPMWQPTWPSLEPTQWEPACEDVYGVASEGKTLSCVMGHFLCLDNFGAPTLEEQAEGASLHGEALRTKCIIQEEEGGLTCLWDLPRKSLKFKRKIELAKGSFVLKITETLENISNKDYLTAWTQHVTLGQPFLEGGKTQFRIPNIRSKRLSGPELKAEQELTFTASENASEFVTHLLDPARQHGYFMAYSSANHLVLGYAWKREDFPWIGIWEEVRNRQHPPWNGETVACGLEFGVSPFPESRKDMIDRGELFDTPCYRRIPAQSSVTTTYCAFLCQRDAMPRDVLWDEDRHVAFQ